MNNRWRSLLFSIWIASSSSDESPQGQVRFASVLPRPRYMITYSYISITATHSVSLLRPYPIMPELPAHASPALAAQDSTRPWSLSRNISDINLDKTGGAPPPAIISPAFTPPPTPGTGTPRIERDAKHIAIEEIPTGPAPKLLEVLPEVNCVVRARIPTTTGQEMFLHLYQNNVDNKEHLAIVFGPTIRSRSLDAPRPGETELDRMIRGAYTGRLYPGRTQSRVDAPTTQASPLHKSLHKPQPSATSLHSLTQQSSSEQPHSDIPLVRIHSECYTGETVWSARCDCGEQLDEAARLMSLPSSCGGVIVYLRQEGRGIGLGEKLKAYNLQDLGSDTVEANLLLRHPADARSYGLATSILADLGLGGEAGIKLLTNNPEKVRAVEGPNREVVVKARVAMVPLAWTSGGKQGINSAEVGSYLRTKVCAQIFPCERLADI